MRTGEVYERFRMRDGRVVTLRCLKASDLDSLRRFVKSLVGERDRSPNLGILLDRTNSKKDEGEWLFKLLKDVRAGRAISVAAIVDREVVGNSDVHGYKMGDIKHVGHLGIAIVDGFRGSGVGTRMLEVLLDRAEMAGMSLVELEVFANNERAIHIYEKLGFRRIGVVPMKIHRGERYIDEVKMYRQS